MILPPPNLEEIPYGYTLNAGISTSMVIADFDFETYSPAGFVWNKKLECWEPPHGARTKGLPTVGMAAYAEHPDAEVLCLAYDLKNGLGRRLWSPYLDSQLPYDLFAHFGQGKLLEAWNVAFEQWVWNKICRPRYGFPELPTRLLRCAAAKARAFSLPGSLDACGEIMNIKHKKLKDGKRLLDKFSIPRNPTKTDPRLRNLILVDQEDVQKLFDYCLRDIQAEAELSSLIPDLQPQELEFWQYDRAINYRGIQIDVDLIRNAVAILEDAYVKYSDELCQLTNGEVSSPSKIAELRKWMSKFGIHMDTLDSEDCDHLLTQRTLLPPIRRALEIRSMLGSAAVKKLYAMLNQVTSQGRLHELFIYHSARTGRAAGSGVQPQNLPNSGPEVRQCKICEYHYVGSNGCPWCGAGLFESNNCEWSDRSVRDCILTINTGSLECVEQYFGNAIAAISGCLRGMFISKPGYDLIGSDYSAIEAVVLAALAGEEWRLEVFRTHGKIYEMSASKITGLDFEEFELYKAMHGQHHPYRKTVGKVAELASGYQGWIGAWKAFGADEFFSEEKIKESILAWRAASPSIVEFWGGQYKGWQQQYYGLEGMAIQAVLYPGQEFSYRGIIFLYRQNVLYCRLLSGRYLTYHKPLLSPATNGRKGHMLSFEGWNTNPKYGAVGWQRMNTYGGKLTENVVQATARDILAHAIINLEKAGYPVVLHVHDEVVVEVPEGFGSLSEMETIMSTMPVWAASWPLKAKGGWRGKRYQK